MRCGRARCRWWTACCAAPLTTRQTAGALANLLLYLADPTAAAKLAQVYEVWQRERARGRGNVARGAGHQQAAASHRAGRRFRLAAGRPRLAGRGRDRRRPARPPGGLSRPGAALAGRGPVAHRPDDSDPDPGSVQRAGRPGPGPQAGCQPCSRSPNRSPTGGCRSWPTN